jgi:hypothetical protein
VVSTDWISDTAAAVTIRPDPFTTEWAAVALVNGLEHLEGAISEREPKQRLTWQQHAEDVRGYEAEISAADVLSRGRFRGAIRAYVARERWTNWQQVTHLTSPSRSTTAELEPLTRILTTTPPSSPGEANTRFGLCVVGLGLAAVEAAKADGEAEFQAKVGFLGKLLGPPPRPYKPNP